MATAVTAQFPSLCGILTVTMLSSIGFHYYETVNQSLQLQWIDKKKAPQTLGWLLSIGSGATLLAYRGRYAEAAAKIVARLPAAAKRRKDDWTEWGLHHTLVLLSVARGDVSSALVAAWRSLSISSLTSISLSI